MVKFLNSKQIHLFTVPEITVKHFWTGRAEEQLATISVPKHFLPLKEKLLLARDITQTSGEPHYVAIESDKVMLETSITKIKIDYLAKNRKLTFMLINTKDDKFICIVR